MYRMCFCAICMDLFGELDCLNAGPCGHVFHSDCLLKWVQEAGSCPECRRQLTSNDLIQLCFDVEESNNPRKAVEVIENEIKELQNEGGNKARKIAQLREKAREGNRKIHSLKQKVAVLETQLKEAITENEILQTSLQNKNDTYNSYEAEYEKLIDEVKELRHVQPLINDAKRIVQRFIEACRGGFFCDCERGKVLVTMYYVLRRERNRVRDEKDNLRRDKAKLKKQFRRNLRYKRK